MRLPRCILEIHAAVSAGIPLVGVRYEDTLHISEYERPHDRDRAQNVDWLELMKKTAATALEIDVRNVFLKRREPQRGNLQHQHMSRDQYEVTNSSLFPIGSLRDPYEVPTRALLDPH